MAPGRPPDAFLSYTRFDDQNDGGAISKFRTRLANAVRALTGEPFEIFQDVDGIGLGEHWPSRLDQLLDEARFLIPILTPSFFTSQACRDELEKFLRAENDRGRNDLVLPIYYIECPVLEDAEARAADQLATTIQQRQCQDWRKLRYSSFRSKNAKMALDALAREILRARQRPISPIVALTELKPDPTSMMLEERAYVDALGRHGMECALRRQEYEITEVGTLLARFRVEALQVLTGNPSCPRLRFSVALPSHGEFLPEFFGLDEDSVRRGFHLESTRSVGGGPNTHWVVPPKPLAPNGAPVSYGVGYACANSITMTRWEALERVPRNDRHDGWDDEWVGVFIAYPAKRLELSVKLPASLAEVAPQLLCRRHPDYPNYFLDDSRHVQSVAPDLLIVDQPVQQAAARHLRQTACMSWQLAIDRPRVGYLYELRWRVPGKDPDSTLADYTRIYQNMLLAFGGRKRAEICERGDEQALRCFKSLCDALGGQLRMRSGAERMMMGLLVYDRGISGLRVALLFQSWEGEPLPEDFNVPLGAGVSGAAFQQRRTTVWVKTTTRRSLIRPRHYPGFDAHAILALPVYHQQTMADSRPPPWSTIGVVVIASDSPQTHLADLVARTPECALRLEELRQVAQAHMIDLLTALTRAQMELLDPHNPFTNR